MKEKIIDFSNGIFTYDQVRLEIEPQELILAVEEGKGIQGSFVLRSGDERRVKGILYTRIPGLQLLNRSFFGRAARIEFTYRPVGMYPGAYMEDRIWVESNAGEYELPVKIQMKTPVKGEEPEEVALPILEPEELPVKVLKKGPGRSEAWRMQRQQQMALAELQIWFEKEQRHACSREEAVETYRILVDRLLELDSESPVYPLLDAWVMLKEGRREEAGWILRKYERTRLFQQRDMRTRAVFLYVNSLYREEPEITESCVSQLQKLYLKYPENWMLNYFLLQLDKQLKEKTRTRYMMLERQFRNGTRSRLLYQEAWKLLKDDMALFTKFDAFSMQTFAWAASHGFLTAETAELVAAQSSKLKKWSPLAARLLKACYQVSPTKETAGAVCGIYIRGHRTDEEAFVWYHKGVELDAKITNLYEYFMYALPENYAKLLPKQVILYFTYHNTLTGRQKTAFYCNLVKHGAITEPDYENHRRQLQEFLLKQLKERRLNEELAWLYGKCLLVETLEKDMLEALADLLFLRKLTCKEKRIRQVEVSYEQFTETYRVPLGVQGALVPIYTPGAKIVLIDDHGKRYRQTVSYDLKRLMIEPKFLEACTAKLKDHLGLNLYLLDGKGEHRLSRENIDIAYRLLDEELISDAYRQTLQLEILTWERKHHRLEKLDNRLIIVDVRTLSRVGQAAYIEYFILLGLDEEAFSLLRKTGCREVEPKLLMRLVQRLFEQKKESKENLLPWARLAFEKGIYTEQIVSLLAEDCQGSTEELLALWKAGKQFDMVLPKLEEQLVVQALFTEQHLDVVYPVFASMEDRGSDPVILSAWLNYLSWLDFVKGEAVPEGLFESLEHHLIWEDRLSDVAKLCYLKQLSVLLLLNEVQKKLVRRSLKELGTKGRRFAFMQKLYPYLEDADRPDDQFVVEYRCNPNHKVILHYVLEYHGKKTFDYVTERVFPVCGGVFTRSFILFYGERLTWFFTEETETGESVSTISKTIENKTDHVSGLNRYHRLCRMQKAADYQQERPLKRMMAEYEELMMLTEEQFHRK